MGVREAGFVRTQLADPLASEDAVIIRLWSKPEARPVVDGPVGPMGASDGTEEHAEATAIKENTKKRGRPRKAETLVTTTVKLSAQHRAYCEAHGGLGPTTRRALDLLIAQSPA